MLTIERYAAPRSLEEAAQLLRGGNATVLAGGTDLMPQSRAGRVRIQPLLINVRRVPELLGISLQGNALRLGSLETITALRGSALVRERLGVLWQACEHFASDQVRNAATLGGNLCNASPAGDTLVPLLALDARVVLASKPDGAVLERRLPLGDFVTGPGRTARKPEELLVAVEVPVPPAGARGGFYKHGTRPGLDIATISIAVTATPREGVLRNVRIALGAVSPTPVRARSAEGVLEGRRCTENLLEEAAAAAMLDIHPISDVRATGWYRRELVRNVLKRTLAHVCGN